MFFGDDVINMKRQLSGGLREMAILAAPAGTMNHLGFQGAVGTRHGS
jgi:hypothetical protein